MTPRPVLVYDADLVAEDQPERVAPVHDTSTLVLVSSLTFVFGLMLASYCYEGSLKVHEADEEAMRGLIASQWQIRALATRRTPWAEVEALGRREHLPFWDAARHRE